jgi:hypothetical protein
VAKAQEDLHRRIKTLEDELQTALEEKERAFRYFWVKGKAKFEQEVLSQHKDLKYWLPSYILHSRFLAVITAPLPNSTGVRLSTHAAFGRPIYDTRTSSIMATPLGTSGRSKQCVVTLSICGL